MSNLEILEKAANELYNLIKNKKIDKVVGIESCEFIFVSLLATKLNTGFIAIRKPGKLLYNILSTSCQIEYGTDVLEIHKDSIITGECVLLHDDVLAKRGTEKVAIELIQKLGGEVV